MYYTKPPCADNNIPSVRVFNLRASTPKPFVQTVLTVHLQDRWKKKKNTQYTTIMN